MISNACATIRTVMSFLPLLRPFIIKLAIVSKRNLDSTRTTHLSTRRSTIGICAFLNCFFE